MRAWSGSATCTSSTAASRVARRAEPPPHPRRISRRADFRTLVLAHVAWAAFSVLAAAILVVVELSAPCPGGGPLAFGDCERIRPLAVATLLTGAGLYVALLTAVVLWVGGLRRRGVADGTTGRDWYLVAAGVGLLACPLLAFTLVSAFR